MNGTAYVQGNGSGGNATITCCYSNSTTMAHVCHSFRESLDPAPDTSLPDGHKLVYRNFKLFLVESGLGPNRDPLLEPLLQILQAAPFLVVEQVGDLGMNGQHYLGAAQIEHFPTQLTEYFLAHGGLGLDITARPVLATVSGAPDGIVELNVGAVIPSGVMST